MAQVSRIAGNLGAWTAYTPTWTGSTTNPVLGNGTLTGKYVQLGKLVIAKATLTAGSTTTFGTGLWRLSLPVAAASAEVGAPYGTWSASDTGVADYSGFVVGSSSNRVAFYKFDNSALVGSTAPFTWGNTDVFMVSFTYEAA